MIVAARIVDVDESTLRDVWFSVTGTPAPKGSFRIVTRGKGGRALPFPRVLDDGPKTTAWAACVRAAAKRAMREFVPFVDQPLHVEIVFKLERPQGHYRKGGAFVLKPSAPKLPAVKPDLDKLLRTTFDAMESVVFDGDSRIVSVDARKEYATGLLPLPGASIRVRVAS